MLVRLAEPISERSLTAYLFYQLQWFDKSLDASSIAKQAGHLTAAFAASQCVTSMWWGRAADSPVLGRKGVLVIGLLGSAVSALGMGFSTTYRSAMLLRMLAGALNGNVTVLRTMVSEVVVDNRYAGSHELRSLRLTFFNSADTALVHSFFYQCVLMLATL
jgi:MFS family permease